MIEMTPEMIAAHYNAMLDSAALIQDAIQNPAKYADDPDVVERNAEHLRFKIAEPYWTDEDMTPVHAALQLLDQ